MRTLILFSLVLFICSCGDDPTPVPEIEGTKPAPKAEPTPANYPTQLTVALSDFRVRSTPNLTGGEVGILKEDALVNATGKISENTTEITLRGIPLSEPWIEIELEKGTGWVYGGGLMSSAPTLPPAFAKWRNERLRHLFGTPIHDEAFALRRLREMIKTDVEMAEYWRNWRQLQTRLNDQLTKYTPDFAPPRWDWLTAYLPGSETTWINSDTVQLFADFNYWRPTAAATTGAADDDFFQLLLQFYPVDSIEYSIPAFSLAPSADEQYSLLGNGKHLELLKALDTYTQKHHLLFESEIEFLKKLLIDDITAGRQLFWYDQEDVAQELKEILKTPLSILNQEDQISLLTQKDHLEEPQRYNIKTGIRERGL